MMLRDMKINILIVLRLKMSTQKMFTILVTPPVPQRKNIKNWALQEPNELIICMQGDFDMAIHILIVPGPKKPPKK